MKVMTLYVFAGPNGSGKSTVISNYIKKNTLFDVEYICPDIYACEVFGDIDDVVERYKKAMDFAEYKRKKLLSLKKSMIIETVLSNPDKLEFLNIARQAGYKIITIFISTSSPDVNIERVNIRVEQGGHHVPREKIISRYNKSMNNLHSLSYLSHEIYVYDNTVKPILAAAIINGDKFILSEAPDWVKKYL